MVEPLPSKQKTRVRFPLPAPFAMTPQIYNKSRTHPVDAVYIGRGSKWGNTFKIGPDGNRTQVIAKYETYLLSNKELMLSLHELEGCDLLCYCSPSPCHGDILLRLANPE